MTSIIHLEDNLLDHKLVASRLRLDGLVFEINRVETQADFLAALQAATPHLILADYSLPQFDGVRALALAQQRCPDVPFIVLSGAMGEQAAVDILKAGATDYILKDRMDRLTPAVTRALREAADRAARARAEQEVREARDIAEAANRAKDHFLAVLSHELRTPLTPTLTAVQTLESDPALATMPAEVREAVQMIRRNIQLEVKLIDDLLDLTRVSRGKLELNLEPTDVHESLRQVIAMCDSDVRNKRLALTLDLCASAPCVRADPPRLQQVLWNIIKNAVKFTDAGGQIVVRTRNQPPTAEAPGGLLDLSVTDSGIGIEAEALPKIFDAFEQGSKQITKQFGGLGLGLAISRALAEQPGGRLTATSPGRGEGATFSLQMPTVAAAVATPAAAPVSGSCADVLSGCRVLLVDDHVDTAQAMGRLLKRWGCLVQTADNVATALTVAQASAFDVLISDIGLPDGSGLDLVRQLRVHAPIRAIAVSGFGMEEDHASSTQAGFAAHLVKPVDLSKLQTTLRRVLAEPVPA